MRPTIAALVTALLAAPVAAQEGGVVSGRVTAALDSTAVVGAEVLVPALARSVRTDSAGGFRLVGLPAGTHRLVVRRLGFLPSGLDVALAAGDSARRDVALRGLPQRLPGVAVVDRVTLRRLERFEERRAMGQGHFLGPEEMEREQHLPFSALLRKRIPGFRLILSPRTGRAYAAASRGPATGDLPPADPFDPRSPRACWAQIYVDGVRVYSHAPNTPAMPAPELDSFTTRDIIAIEAYTAANVPPEYGGPTARCGTLVLWTGAR
ncbi:carboxypeptidase-like regulatory domain-containing protein [Roseisolibacter agri]|uniref:TonB-dependent receptor plug domain-containing protein n=1 Tax=Roseisolibacter agri TaxID=2014610 RepID=A0AA37V7T6_9BACT|nr:carboxypeptidase-like regulatory domain-containing protein [Roseisolibacter agri]GLC27056.1 hypothetical protein rosag_35690 [Roseisolibacter agri]